MNGGAETTSTPASQENKEQTLEQVIGSTGQDDHNDESKKVEKPVEDEKDAVIISLKKELRENKKETKEVKKLVSDLTNLIENDKKSKLSDEKIKAFAEKRGVDPDSIRDLAELLRDEVAPQKQTAKPTDEDESEEEDEDEVDTKPMKFDLKRLGVAVDKMLTDFIKDSPEYKDVVDEETVKELILANPNKYSKLNMNQIVEKIYGKTVQGKKGIENLKNQTRDKEVKTKGSLSRKEFDEIKDNPEAMKEYRGSLLARAHKYGI